MVFEILPQGTKGWMQLSISIGVILLVVGFFFFRMVSMPGKTYSGSLPELEGEEEETARNLQRHVGKLAHEIGERNYIAYAGLLAAAEYLEKTLGELGYKVRSQTFDIPSGVVRNLEVELPGKAQPEEIVVIGGHYDSVVGCPGADDNATGSAAVIELARIFAQKRLQKTIRFVLFVNEEDPHFQTPTMGSLVYANELHERGDNVVAMFSLESIGYFSGQADSQNYPFPLSFFYPDQGNFIGFVGNLRSRGLVRQSVDVFRNNCVFPSEGVAALEIIPGIGWSDHWAFWKFGYKALMVTDTAPFRNPHYHLETDTIETIDYASMARIVSGLEAVISHLAGETE